MSIFARHPGRPQASPGPLLASVYLVGLELDLCFSKWDLEPYMVREMILGGCGVK